MIQNLSLEHYKYIFDLLSELTNAPIIPYENYIKILNNLNENHQIFVYLEDNVPVAIITLLIEQKIIHNGKCVGHIEDLVVKKEYNKKGIAKKLINHCMGIAESNNCYKIILDCKEELEGFYNKYNYNKQGICMRYEI